MEYVAQLVVAFAFYSFVGWCGEVVYNFLRERRWVNRGFLSGPFFLLYGIGAIVPVAICGSQSEFWHVVAIATAWSVIVEYGGSVVLEHIGLSYWDYSDKPYNLHGRVCFESISTFVIGLIALVYIFHPVVVGFLAQLSPALVSFAAALFTMYALIDGHRRLRAQLSWYQQTRHVRNHIS